MAQKDEGPAGGGTPSEASNITYLYPKNSTPQDGQLPPGFDAASFAEWIAPPQTEDYISTLTFFAHRLKNEGNQETRTLIVFAMYNTLLALVDHLGGMEASS